MKRLLALAFMVAATSAVYAQATDTTVCDILKNPASFNNKIVHIKATVSAGFDQFILKGADCGKPLDAIWLAYPEGTKAKSGPMATLILQPATNFPGTVTAAERTPVALDKNSKDFKQFDSLLSTPRKGEGMCLGCMRYEVTASLTGRIDTADADRSRDKSNKITALSGFGNLNAYNVRMVLQSVADVAPQEIDYSKINAITKGETAPQAPGGKPNDVILKAAGAFVGPNISAGERLKSAINAYGKQNEDNGVIVGFTGGNEAPSSLDAKSSKSSPDGVLYNVYLDPRLKGDALSEAMAHVGQHIYDIRTPQSGDENLGIYGLESEAWMTTALLSAARGQKTLSLPGGYLLWNGAWTGENRDSNLREALTDYITKEAMVSR